MSPAKRRMDGYVRVSRVGTRNAESESYITEDVQREKIETWAKLRGVEIAAWHVDRDQSGSKLSRPGFNACMARIAAGKTEGVVVAQIDRLSRADVADSLMIVRKIHDEHHGTLAAVDLGIDPTTEVGEMLLTVLLALARMQWRRYQAAWATAKERAIKRGVHVGPTPLGYRRNDDGRLVPDPVTAAVVREAFRLAATKGLRAATGHLAEHANGRAWSASESRRLLTTRTYLGEIHYGDLPRNSEAHEPLVDLATWTATQRKLNGGATRGPAGNYPLTHVVKCASCGDELTGNLRSDGSRRYRCRRNKSRAVANGQLDACERPAMAMADALEAFVLSALHRHVALEHEGDEVALEMETPGDERAVAEAETVLRSAELARTNDATDVRLREILGDEAFYERLESHNNAVSAAQREYETAVAAAGPRLMYPLVDEVAAATAANLPALLERCGLVVRLAPGRGNLPARVTLAP